MKRIAAPILAAALATATSAAAQDWTGQVTVYGWGAGVSGEFTPFTGAPTLEFDASLGDVLESLDAAFFVTGLARRGDLVLLGDFTYSSSSREGLVPPGAPASGEVTLTSLTLAAGRRFDAGKGLSVDLLGGLRGWDVGGSVSVPAAGIDVSPGATFIDPILAARFNAEISPRWSMLAYADVGGFGVGSEFTWQAALTANYQATERLYISAGWRHLYLDYEGGNGTEFRGSMSGPLLGATWRF